MFILLKYGPLTAKKKFWKIFIFILTNYYSQIKKILKIDLYKIINLAVLNKFYY